MKRSSKSEMKPRLAAFGIAAAIGLPLLIQPAAAPSDPYRGTDGPRAAIISAGGTIVAGAPIRSVIAGGLFAWITTLCPNSDTQVSVETQLVRIASPDATGGAVADEVVSRFDRSWPAGSLACAGVVDTQTVPRDTPAGEYAVLRALTMGSAHGTAATRSLPPIRLIVLAPLQP